MEMGLMARAQAHLRMRCKPRLIRVGRPILSAAAIPRSKCCLMRLAKVAHQRVSECGFRVAIRTTLTRDVSSAVAATVTVTLGRGQRTMALVLPTSKHLRISCAQRWVFDLLGIACHARVVNIHAYATSSIFRNQFSPPANITTRNYRSTQNILVAANGVIGLA